MKIFTLIIVLSCCYIASAQTDSAAIGQRALQADIPSLEELMNTPIISTNRISSERSVKAPATAVVITAEQIRRRGYLSLLDILYDLPEVKIDAFSNSRFVNEITVRGVRGMDKFIILLDGVRISSPTTDLLPVMENYPVHLARQVEVILGPASALYGADAFTGIINIITRKGADLEKGQGSAEVMVAGGMYNNITTNLLVARRLSEKVSYNVSGQYFQDRTSDELPRFYAEDFKGLSQLPAGTLNTIFGPITPNVGIAPDARSQPLSAYAVQAGVQVGKVRLSFFRNHAAHPSTIADNPANSVYNEDSFLGHAVTTFNASYQEQLSNGIQLTSYLTAGYYKLDPRSNFRNVFTGLEPGYKYARGESYKAEQLLYWKLSEQLGVNAGLTYERFGAIPIGHDLEAPAYGRDPKANFVNSRFPETPQGIQAPFPQLDYSNTGGYLQFQYNPTNALTFTIGARYDNNTRFGGTFNPRAGLVFQSEKGLTLKLLYGSAYLAPSPYYTFNQFGSFAGATARDTSFLFRLPNPNLKPQLLNTYEASARQLLSKSVGVFLQGYFTRVTGLFTVANNDPVATQLYNNTYLGRPVRNIEINVNGGTQQVYGGTLGVDLLYTSGTKRIGGTLALSYIDGTTEEREGLKTNLAYVAPWSVKAVLELSIGAWSLSPRLTWYNEQYTQTLKADDPTRHNILKGYVLANMQLNYNLKEGIDFFLTARNLFDTRYRAVNEGAGGAGGASQATQDGAPQFPFRLQGGIRARF